MGTDKKAVIGTFVRVQTMADGSPRITLDLDCTLADLGQLDLLPGVPVAIARISQAAAQEDLRQRTVAQETKGYGHLYTVLYTRGWFHNPRVAHAYDADMDMSPDDRIAHIKGSIYGFFDIESLSELEPQYLVGACDAMGIRDTLPASIIEAAKGQAV